MHIGSVNLAAALLGLAAASSPPDSSKPPNILFFIMDDLDAHMTDLGEIMPSLKKHMIDQGTSFPNHYCTVSLCCPARVSILTGQTAHNHNVTDVQYPEGGYPKFYEQGYNEDYLPVWLQQAGYNTYYVGKILNQLTIENFNDPPMKGWNGSDFLLDPWAYDYTAPAFGRNQEKWTRYKDAYSTDLVAEKSIEFLDNALESDEPFFVGIAPIAPHSEVVASIERREVLQYPPRPAARHKGRFDGLKVPRGPNFNPDEPSGASWIRELEKLNTTQVAFGDVWHRGRLEALLAVDEMVEDVFQKLESAGVLDNTYVIFTSDNGFHIGQHRLSPGKTCGFEEDINVPFYVRGPGIAKGQSLDVVSAHIDIAPTILSLAGLAQKTTFDGRPIPLNSESLASDPKPKLEHASVEMWRDTHGHSVLNGTVVTKTVNHTYKSVRLISEGYNLYYSVWCNNDHELYDMKSDPQQMHNLLQNQGCSNSTRTAHKLAQRLDAMLFVLKSCRGESCRRPWEALMPDADVHTLSDAMDAEHDAFFAEVPKVSFSSCEAGYILSQEGPQFETWPEKPSGQLPKKDSILDGLTDQFQVFA